MLRKVDYDPPTDSNGGVVLDRIAAFQAAEQYEAQPAAGSLAAAADHKSHPAAEEIQLTLIFTANGGGGSNSSGGGGVGRVAVAEQSLPPPSLPPPPPPPPIDLHQLHVLP